MKIDFSVEAEADIAWINREGIRLFGDAQARKYAADLAQAVERIAAFPLANPEKAYALQTVRVKPQGAHVILYAIREDTVLILRVRHGREDWLED